MGGYGSGRWRWHTGRYRVEDCFPLDVNKLRRDRLLYEPSPGDGAWGSLEWHKVRTKEKTGSAGYRIERDAGGIVYRLQYKAGEVEVDLPVQVERLPQHFGGDRWWFRCPLVVNGKPCQRRCGKLYLPPGSRYFGCRICHNLTYTSCNESHQFDGMFRWLARDMEPGTDWREVKRLMKRRW